MSELWVPQRSGDEVPRDALWGYEVAPSRLKATVVARNLGLNSPDQFYQLIKRDAHSQGREVLIYVPGYNVGFSNSLQVAANLSVDLDLRGPTVVYSWPSAAATLAYWRDGNVIADPKNAISEHFVDMVRSIRTANPDCHIYVLAHSMGNRIALKGLSILAKEPATTRLSRVILASPDVSVDDYKVQAPLVSGITNRLTLYASRDDHALQLSTLVNHDARAGTPYSLKPGMAGDKVDTSTAATNTGIGRDLFGHSDYLHDALTDIRALLWTDATADKRCILHESLGYFTFVHTKCSLSVYSDAIVAVRHLGKAAAETFAKMKASVAPSDEGKSHWIDVESLIHSDL